MKHFERFFWLMLITSVIACADLSPKKNFVSTLFYIDWDTKCLTYVDTATQQTLTRCFAYYEQDGEGKWHALDNEGKYMEDIIGIYASDFQKEIDFQNLQKMKCTKWGN